MELKIISGDITEVDGELVFHVECSDGEKYVIIAHEVIVYQEVEGGCSSCEGCSGGCHKESA